MPRYQWSSAQEWLLEKINGADLVEVRSIARELAEQTDNDQIQDSFQSEMDADGFFDDLDAEPTEPEEDDITTEDHEKFYQNGKIVLEAVHRLGSETQWYYRTNQDTYESLTRGTLKNVGPIQFGDDHKAALRAYMERTQFWPNVWFISDHGNAHLITLTEDK